MLMDSAHNHNNVAKSTRSTELLENKRAGDDSWTKKAVRNDNFDNDDGSNINIL